MGVGDRLLVVALIIAVLVGCDLNPFGNSSQANQGTCGVLWDRFKYYMEKAKDGENADKVYYAQIAEMNLSTLLHRDCCRFAETCPSAIQE